MKLVTFNIRYDGNEDGINNFKHRKDLISSKILKESPDIICFQEVLPHVAEWLKDTLDEYYVLGCGREKELEGERVAIAFKKSQYQLIAMNTFWLSNEPNIPGSRYENQSDCPRTCTEVLLQDINSKKIFRVFNVHLDHEVSESRLLSLHQILNYIKELTLFKDAPMIIAGDFNASPTDEEMVFLSQNSDFIDFTDNIKETYHEFGEIEVYEKIDYIFGTKDWKLISSYCWEDEKDGMYLSDHYPVVVEIL